IRSDVVFPPSSEHRRTPGGLRAAGRRASAEMRAVTSPGMRRFGTSGEAARGALVPLLRRPGNLLRARPPEEGERGRLKGRCDSPPARGGEGEESDHGIRGIRYELGND